MRSPWNVERTLRTNDKRRQTSEQVRADNEPVTRDFVSGGTALTRREPGVRVPQRPPSPDARSQGCDPRASGRDTAQVREKSVGEFAAPSKRSGITDPTIPHDQHNPLSGEAVEPHLRGGMTGDAGVRWCGRGPRGLTAILLGSDGPSRGPRMAADTAAGVVLGFGQTRAWSNVGRRAVVRGPRWVGDPEEILAVAPESPWGFPTEVFVTAAREALVAPPTPTHRRALEALPLGGVVLDVGAGAGARALELAVDATGRSRCGGSKRRDALRVWWSCAGPGSGRGRGGNVARDGRSGRLRGCSGSRARRLQRRRSCRLRGGARRASPRPGGAGVHDNTSPSSAVWAMEAFLEPRPAVDPDRRRRAGGGG